MTKSKDRSEAENLRGIIRNLRAENKHLKKQLSRKDKRAFQYEDLEDKLRDIETKEEYVEVEVNKCPKCKGKIKNIELGARILIKCDNCNYRETKKHS